MATMTVTERWGKKYLDASPDSEERFRAAVVRWLEGQGYAGVTDVVLDVYEDGYETSGYYTVVDLTFRADERGKVTINIGTDGIGAFIGQLV